MIYKEHFNRLINRKLSFNFEAFVYINEDKIPVRTMTSLIKWYDKKTVKDYSYELALDKFYRYLNNKYPELKNYFNVF